MKKKPPPGATLIARLREQRLAREAALNGEKEAAAAAAEAPTAGAQTKPPTGEPKGKNSPEPEVTIVHAKPASASEPAKKTQSAEPVHEVTIVEAKKGGARIAHQKATDLIQRDIDINDLRPTSDDYVQLTEEIKLAGRFAAVGLIAQGLRLIRFKDNSIYKDHYPTFEEYCRKEHQMSATYAYRLIRMAEMAERIAERGAQISSDSMPDPFEVMLHLGHRHLMALLPLESDAAEELLIKGIQVSEDGGDERLPLTRATERQIRDALKSFTPEPSKSVTKVVARKSLASEKQLIPALNKLVEMLEDWSLWLGGEAPEELKAARIGRGPLLTKLAKRFRTASSKIADALESDQEK